ncbi:5056_t:CDS:2 [Funneliformis mosseae]|uniref:5056_t:CDS:1 n=1 Tax=Funneliformis mosseae TaxID=27381 RepID=A0A9N9GU43_FUNMO|nr:5056_t:CDS:2 [Funneliformis mosseae]
MKFCIKYFKMRIFYANHKTGKFIVKPEGASQVRSMSTDFSVT